MLQPRVTLCTLDRRTSTACKHRVRVRVILIIVNLLASRRAIISEELMVSQNCIDHTVGVGVIREKFVIGLIGLFSVLVAIGGFYSWNFSFVLSRRCGACIGVQTLTS